MPKVTNELLDILKPFVVEELNSKLLYGVTYAVLANGRDDDKIKYYLELKEKVREAGFPPTSLFRVYELCNGYIFDLDMIVAKKIISIMLGDSIDTEHMKEMMGLIDIHREEEIVRLAKMCYNEHKKGNNEFFIALYSRNRVSKICFNATVEDDPDSYTFTYEAFSVRHWDLERINSEFLIPKGIKIERIEACEILPPRTGAKFKFMLQDVSQYGKNLGR